MGSKNAKPKGRSGETKVRNRGKKKVFIPSSLNIVKVEKLFSQYKENGFKFASMRQLLQEYEDEDGKVKFKTKSLNEFRERVGLFTNQRFVVKTLIKCNKKEFMEDLYNKGLLFTYEQLLEDCKSSPEYCKEVRRYFN